MFHLISHELAQQASTMCWTWEEILHIYKQPCIILFTLQTDNNTHDDFPKISDYFQKISEDFQTFVWRPDKCLQTFLKNFRGLSKIAKDFQGRSEDVLIIHHQIYKYSLRVWRDIISEDRENTVCTSRVPHAVVYEFYKWSIFQ